MTAANALTAAAEKPTVFGCVLVAKTAASERPALPRNYRACEIFHDRQLDSVAFIAFIRLSDNVRQIRTLPNLLMHTLKNRLDPSLIDKNELRSLTEAFAAPGHVKLIDEQGNVSEIPKEFFQHLARLIRLMNEGRAVVMMPVDENFTTQAAANHLGVSRQHLVDLLERGEIPFHRAGTHRRIAFKDLLEYEDKRDRERHEGLNQMFRKVAASGKYEGTFTGETR